MQKREDSLEDNNSCASLLALSLARMPCSISARVPPLAGDNVKGRCARLYSVNVGQPGRSRIVTIVP